MEKRYKVENAILRQKAEKLIKKKTSQSGVLLSEIDALKLIHELQVHQIELELQNEELILAKEKAEHVSTKYTELYDSAPTGFFSLAPKGEILELNPAGAKMLGNERENLKDRLFQLYISNTSKPIFNLFLEKVFAGNIKQTCELTLSTNTDHQTYIDLSGIVSENREKCFVTAIDTTERRKSEKEIIMLAHSLESISECVSITDLDDKVMYINESFTRTYGYKKEELIGKKISIIGSSNNPPELISEILPATRLGGWTGELLNKRKDLSEFPIRLSTTTINDKAGKTLGLIGVATDITERRLFEQELIGAKERAEESDGLKSSFLANMSHEVRTPLNSIIGFSELLTDPDFEDDQKNKFISHIITNGNILLNIISDIMDISKLESGELKIHNQRINVYNYISNIKNQYAFQAREKNLELMLSYPIDSEETAIFADPDRLSQIINNLISNALKFTENGKIEIGYQPIGKMVEFCVKDTGIGIPEKYQKKIFERFRQVDDQSNRKFGGNGLGLAISKNLVELMGGKIWLVSEPGVGSKFYFTLPLIS